MPPKVNVTRAASRNQPGCTAAQTITATAAAPSSTMIPAAAMVARAQRSGRRSDDVASTCGRGISNRNVRPTSWVAQPQRRSANAWPNSCKALSSG